MTAKELIEELQNWPEDTEVEIAVPVDPNASEPWKELRAWLALQFASFKEGRLI